MLLLIVKNGGRGVGLIPDIRYCINGAVGRSRTCDHQIRSLVLYPAELQPHKNRQGLGCNFVLIQNQAISGKLSEFL